MEECYQLSGKEVSVVIRIHSPNFSTTVETKTAVTTKLQEIIDPIQYSTNMNFMIFSKGEAVLPGKTFQELSMTEGT